MTDASLDDVKACVCTVNEATNITTCLESIRQTGIIDILVVDGGSTDKTATLAREAGAIVLQTDRGLAKQRQAGIDACEKPFLFFVDADDRLHPKCPAALLRQMQNEKYDALQAQLRVLNPRTYWQLGMDALLEHCICRPGPSNMVGRPALYRTKALRSVGMDTSFDGIGNEDTALSIRMEQSGFKQGVGSGVCYRIHPATFRENAANWHKYGKGDAMLIRRYPSKTFSILEHLLINYPLKRSLILVKNGAILEIGYTIIVGVARFLFMCFDFLSFKNKHRL